ncbi:putative TIGR01777 family protein [Actinoalloteichus sp. GBA129-24]|uniref:TIGR01777 family protein n=2 Tax=Pseudonocardiaceae TaxID=2070 RepID=A0AAC9PTT7_9PSEU|nr:putative TIGR01777 family protein [Actinoalloteichus fjordicus]APU23109.1 putative TIGR01777 family protein [Actinoalloteichus sp. GBA129-24]
MPIGDDHAMRIVIAGSSGLIGTACVALLRRRGHEVVRLVRRAAAAPDERSWDPPSGVIEPGALDGADAVINLCGVGILDRRWSDGRQQIIRDSRLVPSEVLAGAVADAGVPVLVNGSAVGYYGDTGDRAVDEGAPAGAGFVAGLCVDWEDAAAGATASGGRLVIARSGIVLARSGGLLGRLRPLFSAMLGGRLGSGRQYMSWISLEDHVAALCFLIENESISGPVNLTAPAPVTNDDFTRALATAVGRPAPWVVPGFALRAVVGGAADEMILTGQRAVPRELARHGFQFAHPTVDSCLPATVGG